MSNNLVNEEGPPERMFVSPYVSRGLVPLSLTSHPSNVFSPCRDQLLVPTNFYQH